MSYSQIAAASSSLLMPTAVALLERPWGDNLGGIGTPKDKILYELINQDTIDTVSGYKLSI